MKKYLLILPLLVISLLLFSGSVRAAEITPAEGSYSYGSTSEMSASSTYDEERETDALADTGEAGLYIVVGALALIVIGAVVTRRSMQS